VLHLHIVLDISVMTSYTSSLRSEKEHINLMYVSPCIIYEIDERYPLDATIYLFL